MGSGLGPRKFGMTFVYHEWFVIWREKNEAPAVHPTHTRDLIEANFTKEYPVHARKPGEDSLWSVQHLYDAL